VGVSLSPTVLFCFDFSYFLFIQGENLEEVGDFVFYWEERLRSSWLDKDDDWARCIGLLAILFVLLSNSFGVLFKKIFMLLHSFLNYCLH
jgi:hypothetical protein